MCLIRRSAALLLALAAPLASQEAPISDNSFLLEEAYNQEAGVVQHVGVAILPEGGQAAGFAFTQEWPLFGQRQQVSFTIPLLRLDGETRFGDVEVQFRQQARSGRVAVAPSVTVILPTGHDAFGAGNAGFAVGLPVSVQVAPSLVAHTNASVGVLPNVGDQGEPTEEAMDITLGQSAVWLAHPRLNVLLEAVWSREQAGDVVTEGFVLSPGVRGAINLGNTQIVPGLAVPIGVGPSSGERSVYLYLSVEHPF